MWSYYETITKWFNIDTSKYIRLIEMNKLFCYLLHIILDQLNATRKGILYPLEVHILVCPDINIRSSFLHLPLLAALRVDYWTLAPLAPFAFSNKKPSRFEKSPK